MTWGSDSQRALERVALALERSAKAHERDATAREAMAEMMRVDHEQLAEANRQSAVLMAGVAGLPRRPGDA